MSYTRYEFVLKPLPYEYNALEPFIDAQTVELHHNKHEQTYVDNLNKALQGYPTLQRMELTELIRRATLLPMEARIPIINNAGGVYNHIMYFDGMRPTTANNRPVGKLEEMITKQYGDFEKFKAEFSAEASKVFGSGYAWLVYKPKSKPALQILSTANQNTPLSAGYCPIILLDVWEHAYYLKYKNKRGDYIDRWWNIVNWDIAEERYKMCRDGLSK